MNSLGPWILIILGLGAAAALVLGIMALMRARAAHIPLSPDGLKEFEQSPLTPLQKNASWGFGIALILLAGILFIFHSSGGAMIYDENADVRMQILWLFLGSLLNFSVLSTMSRRNADERDKGVWVWAPHAQSIAVLLVVVAWLTWLPVRFRDEGGIPTIYCYLMGGTVWLTYMIAFFVGILLGSWVSPRHAQG